MDLNAQTSTNLFHEASFDNGVTWGPTTNLTKFGEVPGTFYLASQGDITHLLQIVNETGGKSVMSNLVWENDQWVRDDDLRIDGTIQGENSISADIDPQGLLGAAVIAQKPEQSETGTSVIYEILYVKQLNPSREETNASTIQPTPLATEPIVTPQTQEVEPTDSPPGQIQVTPPVDQQNTPEPTIIPTESTSSVDLTPTPETGVSSPVPTVINSESPASSPSTMNVFILAGIVAILVVGTGLVISLYSARR
jgi:hypothetical protein